MSATWIDAFSHGTALWAEAMTRACWQGSAVLGLAWLACRAWRGLQPAARCWLWRLACLKLITALLWAQPVVLPLRYVPTVARWWGEAAPLAGGDAVPADKTPLLGRAATAATRPSPAELLGLLWLLGVAGFAIRFAARCRQTRRWREDAAPLSDEALVAECQALCRRLGLRRAPRLLIMAGDGSPWLVGIRSPAIIFPASLLAACSESELRLMLAHELAHLQRRDLLWGWLGTTVQGLFFFHPLVWLAGGEWRLAQEMACDATAMAITRAPAAEYGGVLLKVAAQRHLDLQGGPVTVGVLESYHTLKRRLIAMKSFGSLSPQQLGSAGVTLAMLGALALIPWRVVAETPAGPHVMVVFTRGGPAGEELFNLARRPDVQSHLQFSPTQTKAFAELQQLWREAESKEGEEVLALQGLSEEEMKARFAERAARIRTIREGLIQQLGTLLSPVQLQRLRELSLQWQGPLALNEPQTADAVGLTPAHRAEIARIVESMHQASQNREERFKLNPAAPHALELYVEGPEAENREKSTLVERRQAEERHRAEEEARIKEAAGRIVSALDARERARWYALQGAPFAFSLER